MTGTALSGKLSVNDIIEVPVLQVNDRYHLGIQCACRSMHVTLRLGVLDDILLLLQRFNSAPRNSLALPLLSSKL